jgi:hypothetical protein
VGDPFPSNQSQPPPTSSFAVLVLYACCILAFLVMIGVAFNH